MIASIHNLGKCPCPCCLIPLCHVHCIRTAGDLCQRTTLAHVDNREQRGKVHVAQRLIYERNSLVNSSAVEALLQDKSLVPTVVSSPCSYRLVSEALQVFFRMCSPIGCPPSGSIYFQCFSPTSCTKLNLGAGGLSSFIFCRCFRL